MRGGSKKTLEVAVEEEIDSMCFSPDGRHIAVGMSYGDLLLWNVRTGQMVEKLAGHLDSVYALAFSPDGAELVSGGQDGTVRFWKIRIDRTGLRDNNVEVINNTGKQVWRWNRTVVVFSIDLYICTDFVANRMLLIALVCHPMAAGSFLPQVMGRYPPGMPRSLTCSVSYTEAIMMDFFGLGLVCSLII